MMSLQVHNIWVEVKIRSGTIYAVMHRFDFHFSKATPFMSTKSERYLPKLPMKTESGDKWIGAMSGSRRRRILEAVRGGS